MINPTKKQTLFELVIDCASRLICVAALAWFGLLVTNAIGSMKRADTGVASENQTAVNVPRLLMPAAGHWSFADTELSIEQTWCSQQELTQRLENLYAIDDSPGGSGRDASELVALAKLNGATRTNCKAGWAWTFEDSQLQLCLVTTNSKTPQLKAAAFAMRGNERWQLTILKPQPPLDDHLLPLPVDTMTADVLTAETQATCVRRGEDGELQMELISTTLSDEQLLAHWRRCGWEVRHTSWGAADSFSYLCARGDEVVYAWSDGTLGRRTLMLTTATDSTLETT